MVVGIITVTRNFTMDDRFIYRCISRVGLAQWYRRFDAQSRQPGTTMGIIACKWQKCRWQWIHPDSWAESTEVRSRGYQWLHKMGLGPLKKKKKSYRIEYPMNPSNSSNIHKRLSWMKWYSIARRFLYLSGEEPLGWSESDS